MLVCLFVIKMTNPDKMRENELLTSKGSNSMDFGLKNIMDFATNIDKLNLADLVAEVIDKIMEFHILTKLQKITPKGQTAWIWF